ncbi:hypothetical protein K443DRAFT_674247 [Laccaria amethystina LaAM-08-1]|uniref:Uncharacterized protein n=1 Tax=Laccaria amethystina LaAM-08-1 TaxID=1095629 RepID=A0A0C9YER3_9AGAR|nr:hypothetical protein K443DRAFT_674247 [Laccaria amethystina LaAM-08-1]
MNAFPAGTRVFYWSSIGQIIYATVQSSSRLPDGTQLLLIKDDAGEVVTLPAAGVNIAT